MSSEDVSGTNAQRLDQFRREHQTRPAPAPPPPRGPQRLHVVVADVDIPFWSLVRLMLKWALAAVPAAIVLYAIFFAAVLLFISVFGMLVGGAMLAG